MSIELHRQAVSRLYRRKMTLVVTVTVAADLKLADVKARDAGAR